MKAMTLRLPLVQYEKMKMAAETLGIPMQQFVSDAINARLASTLEEISREKDNESAWYPGCELDRSRRRSQFETTTERKARLPSLGRPASPDYAVSTGEYVREWLEDNDRDLAWLAREMNVSSQFITSLLAGDVPLLWLVAKKLEEVTGIEARIWANQERLYRQDLKRLRQ